MQPAGTLDGLRARMHDEMQRIGEHELHSGVIGALVVHKFHRAIRADDHKARSVHDAVRRVQSADTRSRTVTPRDVQQLVVEKGAR